METFEISVETRPDDLDRSGDIGPAALLRLTEWARWRAIEGSALGMEAIFRDGRSIVVRGQRLSILRPLRRHLSLRITLWVDRVGTTSIVLGHDVIAPQGETLATLRATGVCLDASRHPTPAPDVVRAAAASSDPPSRDPLFAKPAERDPASSVRVRVRESDVDILQHVNHAVYLDYYLDAEAALARSGEGGPTARAPVAEVELHYQREAFAGDELQLDTWVASRTADEIAFAHELRRPGEVDPINRAFVVRGKGTPDR